MKIQEWLDKHGLSLDSEFDEETVQRAVTAEIEFSFPDLSEEQQREIDLFRKQAVRKEDVITYAKWLASGDIMVWNSDNSEMAAYEKIMEDREIMESIHAIRYVEPFEYLTFRYRNGLVAVGLRARVYNPYNEK